MKKSYSKKEDSVNIATLKAHLAKYLRFVKSGREVVVMDHKMPVAKIIPFESGAPLESIKPSGDFSANLNLKIPALRAKPGRDTLSLLQEERGSR